ncbi:MAG: aminotransferase class I/II-fold pyridoxal phosphate-dependent enzyme [Mariprofundaceae bacterium]|nr:aminotransferase class I/II-fold pyridoxal phosphate-dependent enzyme [Mariprofundaceae bacterium]
MSGYSHGGNIESYARRWRCDTTDILDLSTGLNPKGAPDFLPQWLKDNANLVTHYPDTDAEPARSAIAQDMGVDPSSVWICAGAQEAIEVIFSAMQWKSVAIMHPCYTEPIRCANRAHCHVKLFQFGETYPESEALWLTSPHNPCGRESSFPKDRKGVLDESYMPFSQRRKIGLLPDVIRIGSLTKTFCIPGIRLAYIIASPEQINRVRVWLPPWPASTFALHLLAKLLPLADEHDAFVNQARERMLSTLKEHQWQSIESNASFVLAKPKENRIPNFSIQRIMVRTFPEWPQLHGWYRLGLFAGERNWGRFNAALC